MPNINLHNLDCMEFLKGVPDKYYDLAIVDPPYGIGDFRNRGVGKGEFNHKPKDGHRFDKVKWNEVTPDKSYFDELYRVSRNQIIWGANYYWDKIPFSGAIVWNKKQPLDTLSQVDIAACSLHNRTAYFEYLWAGVMRQNDSPYDRNRIHPCEKPVELYKWLLNKYAKAGDKILDTHLGSGSIAIACHDLNFDLDGCELDPDYYAAMLKRFNQHASQIKMF